MRDLIEKMYGKISGGAASEGLGLEQKFDAIINIRHSSRGLFHLEEDQQTPSFTDTEYQQLLLTAAKETNNKEILDTILREAGDDKEILEALINNPSISKEFANKLITKLFDKFSIHEERLFSLATTNKNPFILEALAIHSSLAIINDRADLSDIQKNKINLFIRKKIPNEIIKSSDLIIEKLIIERLEKLSVKPKPEAMTYHNLFYVNENIEVEYEKLVSLVGKTKAEEIVRELNEKINPALNEEIKANELPAAAAQTPEHTPSFPEQAILPLIVSPLGSPQTSSPHFAPPEAAVAPQQDQTPRRGVKFKGEAEINKVTKYEPEEPITAELHAKWVKLKELKESHAKISEQSDEVNSTVMQLPTWSTINDHELSAHIQSSRACCEAQIQELGKLIDVVEKASNIYEQERAVRLAYLREIRAEYVDIITQCGGSPSANQPVQTTATQSQKPPAAQPVISRDATKEIVARTCAANYKLEQTAQSLQTHIPSVGDIAKRIAKNTWNFVKNNKALFMGAVLVAVGVGLLLTPAAPLGLGLLAKATIGFVGAFSLPIKAVKNWFFMNKEGQMIDSIHSLTNASGGLREAKRVLPGAISCVVTAKSEHDKKIPLKNAEPVVGDAIPHAPKK